MIANEQEQPLVITVLLNWNGTEFTIPCVRSLQEQTYQNQAIVVVDNGSKDDSVAILQRELGDEITLLTVMPNGGFSAICNLGIEQALTMGAEYVLILNNDTILDQHCIEELVKQAESDHSIGAVTCKMLYYEPNDLLWFAGGDAHRGIMRFTARGLDEKDNGQYDQVAESPFICGCCALIPRRVIEKVGMFDARFFAYVEDSDLSLRIAAAGYRLVYTPKAVLWHRVSATMNKNYLRGKVEEYSPEQYYYGTRNRVWVVRKNGTLLEKWGTIGLLSLRAMFRIPLFLIMRRGKSLRSIWRGLRDGVFTDLRQKAS